ncbi:hypothetical protein SAMN05421831_104119 [Allopseudospirillum japonicum]|uniref:Uncharacterized protein n=1 Tax=Allopseudospirillum japonicum TaxID=64971 RepID=A0A1H6RKY1_9GAMM|nr:hypothetical protein [Allopseudospirillum japonicum]SEI56468.1 hypothetical protein SAMN05421831_104119 [Allopseudospirillum japonicum]
MTFAGVITIILYALAPYWWLLVLLLLALIGAQVLGRHHQGTRPRFLYPLCVAIGLLTALVAPWITGSSLNYVQTSTDILTLLAVMLGSGFYAFLLLNPLLRISDTSH